MKTYSRDSLSKAADKICCCGNLDGLTAEIRVHVNNYSFIFYRFLACTICTVELFEGSTLINSVSDLVDVMLIFLLLTMFKSCNACLLINE